ncbi:MAG: class II glutamine amidotransferase [Proteobacteria bacterium]|nr:class II glutamine amidotransferase [Pseudomonadota bacterium]
MCRLFGFRSAAPSGAHKSLMEAENALAVQSLKHPHGWGIGWFAEEEVCVIKTGNAAHECGRFRAASQRLTSNTMVVHVRRATVGSIDHLNAHPFHYGRWLFAHNGTIFGMDEGLREWMLEQVDEGFAPLILGDTDSECLFYFLLSAMADNGVDRSGRGIVDPDTVLQVVRRALWALDEEVKRRGLERPITNVILTNGATFLAHRAGMPLFLSTQKRFCPDFETCSELSKVCMERVRPPGLPVNHILVASEVIANQENVWEELEDGSTVLLYPDFRMRIAGAQRGWKAPILPERFRIKAS